jgi:hypothetical protein
MGNFFKTRSSTAENRPTIIQADLTKENGAYTPLSNAYLQVKILTLVWISRSLLKTRHSHFPNPLDPIILQNSVSGTHNKEAPIYSTIVLTVAVIQRACYTVLMALPGGCWIHSWLTKNVCYITRIVVHSWSSAVTPIIYDAARCVATKIQVVNFNLYSTELESVKLN